MFFLFSEMTLEVKDRDQLNDEEQVEKRVVKWHPSFSDEVIKANRPKSCDPVRIHDRPIESKQCVMLIVPISFKWVEIGQFKGHLVGGDKNCSKCPNVWKWISKEIRDYVDKRKVNANKRKGRKRIFDQETEIADLEDPKNMQPLKKKLMVSGFISSSRSTSVVGPLELK